MKIITSPNYVINLSAVDLTVRRNNIIMLPTTRYHAIVIRGRTKLKCFDVRRDNIVQTEFAILSKKRKKLTYVANIIYLDRFHSNRLKFFGR